MGVLVSSHHRETVLMVKLDSWSGREEPCVHDERCRDERYASKSHESKAADLGGRIRPPWQQLGDCCRERVGLRAGIVGHGWAANGRARFASVHERSPRTISGVQKCSRNVSGSKEGGLTDGRATVKREEERTRLLIPVRRPQTQPARIRLKHR